MTKSIFLSHSHLDKSFALKIFQDLQAQGIRVWFDEAELRPGDSLIGRIEAALETMDFLGVLLSRNSVESEWVLREVRIALTQEINGRIVKVIPLLVEDCRIPGFLLDKLFVDFRDTSSLAYRKSLDLLVGTLLDQRKGRANLHESSSSISWIRPVLTKSPTLRGTCACGTISNRLRTSVLISEDGDRFPLP
jgi:hypothetical protein